MVNEISTICIRRPDKERKSKTEKWLFDEVVDIMDEEPLLFICFRFGVSLIFGKNRKSFNKKCTTISRTLRL